MALTLLLAMGCVPALNQEKAREANTAVPGSFGDDQVVGGEAAQPTASSAEKVWSEFFTDPHLRALIETALENNQELNIRLQEIIVAQSEVLDKKGEYLPKVGLGVGAGIEKPGAYTSQGVSDEANDVATNLPDYRFGLGASWELDIWKKLRNSAKSARFRYLASIEGRNFVVTQLVAEIANSYYELLALDSRLEVLKANIQIQKSALDVVKMEKAAGRVTELAVKRFEAEVLKNQSLQYSLEQQIIETENRINFLVGRFPQPVARNAEAFEGPLPNVVEAGIPSQLLDNRPDVRQAELELEARKLDVKVAKARFYPSLSIEAGVGYESFNIKHLVQTPESLIYNVAGNLMAPLLNRNAIKAQYFSANAKQIQAVFNYERTLLQAFTDVANLLAMIKNMQESYDRGSQQVDALVESVAISNVLFQSARADYVEVLLTRRDSLEAQMQLIETKQRQLHAMVGIYQALGGGWR